MNLIIRQFDEVIINKAEKQTITELKEKIKNKYLKKDAFDNVNDLIVENNQ